MKHVKHVCQRQKVFAARLGAFSPRTVVPSDRQNLMLACTRWRTGRKLNIKVSVINATD